MVNQIMKINRWQIYITIVFLFLGFLIAFQYESTSIRRFNSNFSFSTLDKQQELQEKIVNQKKENQELEKQIQEIEEEIRGFEQSLISNEDEANKIREQLDNTRMIAGLISVEGPGLSVTLNDSKQAKEVEGDVSSYIVHEQDLRKVVNELFASGAEAISVNGERMIASSSIRCVGPTILVNSIKKAPPFEILAIGDPDTLLAGLEMPGGVLETLRLWNIQISTKKMDHIVIPGFIGTLNTDRLTILNP